MSGGVERGTAQGPQQAQNHAKPARMLGAGIRAAPSLSRSADARLQAGLRTPRLADFRSSSSSTGVYRPVRGSSPSSARGRALGGGDCVPGGPVRSGAGGGPERRARNAGRGQAGPEAQLPPRAAAKLSRKFESGGGRSLGVGVSPVLQLFPLSRGWAREELLSATDWVGIPLPPRAPSRSWRCLRGSVRETAPRLRPRAHALSGRADRICGSTQPGQASAGLGHCSYERGAHPHPTLSGTQRLRGSGRGQGDRAGCDGVLRLRECASLC